MKNNLLKFFVVISFTILADKAFATFCTPIAGETCATAITMANNTCQNLDNSAACTNADYTAASYPCAASLKDMFVEITITSCSHITLTATSSIGGNINLMLLSSCSAILQSRCGVGTGAGQTVTGQYLPPGTYIGMVSGATANGIIRLCNTVTSAGAPPANDACASPINLTAGSGYNANLAGASNALSGTNYCATAPSVATCGTANQDTYTFTDMGSCYITNFSNPGAGATNPCWPSVENTVWYQFTAPTTDNYYFELFNQTCNTPNGVQFLVTSVKNCTNAELTSGGLMTALSGGSGGYACTSTSTTNNIYLEVNLVAGTTYYLAIDGYAGSACNFQLLAGIVQSIPLPLNIISFAGKSVKDGNLIEWVIEDDDQSKSYVLEKSTNGKNFVNVETFRADKSDNGSFKFLDTDITSETNYYRITVFNNKSVSKNRTEVISVTSSQKKDIALFNVYPNPGESTINVSFHSDNTNNKDISVYNAMGLLVKKIQVQPQEGLNELKLNVNDLEKGFYQILLVSGTNTETIKFIKN